MPRTSGQATESIRSAIAQLLYLHQRGRLPEGCALIQAVETYGGDSDEVNEVVRMHIDSLCCLLGCLEDEVVDMCVGHPELFAVTEDHIVNCLLTLRILLPEADVAKVVCKKVELLTRDDALDKAREAVSVLKEHGLNPSHMIEDQPLLLLYHHVWFAKSKSQHQWDEEGAMTHDG